MFFFFWGEGDVDWKRVLVRQAMAMNVSRWKKNDNRSPDESNCRTDIHFSDQTRETERRQTKSQKVKTWSTEEIGLHKSWKANCRKLVELVRRCRSRMLGAGQFSHKWKLSESPVVAMGLRLRSGRCLRPSCTRDIMSRFTAQPTGSMWWL